MAIVVQGDCNEALDKSRLMKEGSEGQFALTFLDPPFNQGKEYAFLGDDLPEAEYWGWMKDICAKVIDLTHGGGALYFMQREKNAENVLTCLRQAGWNLQNIIIWTKKTSAVPNAVRYGKQYQIIAFATKGKRPHVFNRLRIDAPLRPEYKVQRENGLFVTDVWDDIREMTSGYFAGGEALRSASGERAHKQQSPVALLLRIILSSTKPGDWVLDPFAGTGTTLVVSEQLGRKSLGIEIDPINVKLIRNRLDSQREADSVTPLRHYYRHSLDLRKTWLETGAKVHASTESLRV